VEAGKSNKNRLRAVERLGVELHATYLALRDPRTPWYAKALALCVLAYAASPIDLIPDPIPILGQLDDLVLVPLGLALVWRLVPAEVREDCRRKASDRQRWSVRGRWLAAGAVLLLWTAVIVLAGWIVNRVRAS
jgi:uncharacterized membrane protein YkvA (DUF1232 family)